VDAWPLLLQKERQGYEDLKKKFIIDPSRDAQEKNAQDWTLNNPLSLEEDVRGCSLLGGKIWIVS
jgi:hypothetical protein